MHDNQKNNLQRNIVSIVIVGIVLIFGVIIFQSLSTVGVTETSYSDEFNLLANDTSYNLEVTGDEVEDITLQTYNNTWLDFDGVDDWINLTSVTSGKNGTGFVISFTVKNQNRTLNHRPIGFNNLLAIRALANTTSFQIFGGNGTTLSGAKTISVPFNEWTTIDVEYNGSGAIYIYKNGVYQDQALFNSSRVTFTYPNSLARGQSDASSEYYLGNISNLMIFNRSFNSAKKHVELMYQYPENRGLGIPIILYHNILEDGVSTSVNYSEFQRQMAYLNSTGFNTISIQQLLNYMNNVGSLPSKPILITFDDAGKSVYTNASVIMNNYSFVGTFFLATNQVGLDSDNVNWSDLQQLVNLGWSMGSHTANHINLTLLNYSQRILEYTSSISAINGNLSYNTISFSCPYSIHNSTIDAELANYFNITFCDYWTVKSQQPVYLHKGYPLIGTNVSRGDVANTVSITDFISSVNLYDQLMLYYKFNENEGTTAYDTSGNSNNGTISGATWQNDGILINNVLGFNITSLGVLSLSSDYLYRYLMITVNSLSDTNSIAGNQAILIANSLADNAVWINILIITTFAVLIFSLFKNINPENEKVYY